MPLPHTACLLPLEDGSATNPLRLPGYISSSRPSAAEGFQRETAEIQGYEVRKDSYPLMSALDPVREAVNAVSGKAPGWYLADLRHYQDRLLGLKEDVLDPVRKFWNGAQRSIHDAAQRFLADQKANFAYAGAEVSERIRAALDDHAASRAALSSSSRVLLTVCGSRWMRASPRSVPGRSPKLKP